MANLLSGKRHFQATAYVLEKKASMQNMTLGQIASKMTESLGFLVTANNVQRIFREHGIETSQGQQRSETQRRLDGLERRVNELEKKLHDLL